MKPFMPDRVFFEPASLDYPLGVELFEKFKVLNIPVKITSSHNRVTGIPGKNPREKYFHAKRTLVIGIKKDLSFESCKPSAHYQFPLATSCPGHCEYCYLQTSLGARPYIRVYVNINEIHQAVIKHIEKHLPRITVFEASSSADPLAVEHLTGSLKKTIEFFSELDYGRLRFVTKFDNVDSLLNIRHNRHTRFRFSINADYVIKNFEHHTPPMADRIDAIKKVSKSGYPTGFIIAPIMIFKGWKEQYADLLKELSNKLSNESKKDLTFELITHRFTKSAKKVILERFPETKLVLTEEGRRYKYGKYGLGKYVYEKNLMSEIEIYLNHIINEYFPDSKIEYFT